MSKTCGWLMTGSLHTTCGEPMSQGAQRPLSIEANECVVSIQVSYNENVSMNEYKIYSYCTILLLFVVRSVWEVQF